MAPSTLGERSIHRTCAPPHTVTGAHLFQLVSWGAVNVTTQSQHTATAHSQITQSQALPCQRVNPGNARTTTAWSLNV